MYKKGRKGKNDNSGQVIDISGYTLTQFPYKKSKLKLRLTYPQQSNLKKDGEIFRKINCS